MSHVFLEQNGSNMEKMPVKPPNCLETSHGAQMLHHREMSVGTDHGIINEGFYTVCKDCI